MTLLNQWRSIAYDSKKSKSELDIFWEDYFQKEKNFYNILLNIQEHPILDTVENFADKFNVDVITMIGFLDGLNSSLKIPNNIETLTKETIVTLDYDAEKLYKNALVAKAENIYSLEIWNNILPNRNDIQQQQQQTHIKNVVDVVQSNTPKCPKCGSTNIQLVKRKWSPLMGFMTNKVDRVCVNCKNKF